MTGNQGCQVIKDTHSIIIGLAEEYDYVCYIDMDKQEVTRYKANSVFLQQMEGVNKEQPTFDQLRELFKKTVHPDDLRRFEKMVDFSEVAEILETEELFKYLFRAVINGRDVFYSINFIKDKTNPSGIIMGLLNIDAKARSELKRIEAESMLESANYIKALADEFEAFCDIDIRTGTYETIVCNEQFEKNVQRHISDQFDFYATVQENAPHLIYEEDLETVLKFSSLKYVKKALGKKDITEMEFRFVIDGEPVWHYARAAYKDENRDRIVIGISNIQARKEAELEQKRAKGLIEMLAGSYIGVYYVNFEDGSYIDYQPNSELQAEYSNFADFRDCINKFIKEKIFPADQHRIEAIADFDNLKKQLKRKTRFSVVFREVLDGYPHYCEAQVIRVGVPRGQEIKSFLLTLEDRDEEIRSQREQEAVIKTMSNDFRGIWYIHCFPDKSMDRVSVFRHSEVLEAKIPKWSETIKLTERFSLLCDHFVYPEDRQSFWEKTRRERIFEQLKKDPVYLVNFRALVDGKIHYYQLKIVRLTRSLSNRTMVIGFRNIDREMELESEREKQQRDLAEALALAREANAAKTTFLFNMSHDIRTPMNAIVGFTQMARKHMNNPEKLKDCLNKVDISSKLLLQLINDVLDMARVESGKVYIEENVTNVCDIADNLLSMIKDSATAKNISLSHEFKNVTDKLVYADVLHLNQVLINLLSNAIKYTRNDGKVSFTVEQLPVPVGAFVNYRFTVADNGIGMSEDFLAHIFEHFSRERTSTVSGIQGTGLGMSIVKRLVDLLGGTIDIKSKTGQGTTITVDLKFRSARGQNINSSITPTDVDIDDDRLDGVKVLLVEDNELNREIAREFLTSAGAEVDEAEDGAVAVEKVQQAHAGRYDIILMDIQMPYMDGYLATMAIRTMRDHPLADVPIVAMTANAFEEDKNKAKAAGMNAHLAKPIDVTMMLKTIKQFTAKK